jgi:hypothetical protein
MTSISTFFVRAKHWQLFALFIGTEFAGFVGSIVAVVSASPSGKLIGGAFTLPSYMCPLAWWWYSGSLLNSAIRPRRELNFGLFRSASIFMLLSVSLSPFLGAMVPQSGTTLSPFLVDVIAPVALLFFFCMFYVQYFLSKSFVLKNKGQAGIGAGDVGYFFLFLFFVFGVWVIQPRINQIYAEKRNTE